MRLSNDQDSDEHGLARSVFAGLAPHVIDPVLSAPQRGRMPKGVLATGSVLLAGSMAAMGLTGPITPAEARTADKPRDNVQSGKTARQAAAAPTVVATATVIAPAPATYLVTAGDTVSGIAERYGLSTASVLALNGLGWSSIIFPGQELTLSAARPAVDATPVETVMGESADTTASGRYTVVAGDTISAIADRFGVATLSALAANGLSWSSIIYPGQVLIIPGLVGPGTPADDDRFVPVVSTTPLAQPVAPEAVVAAPVAPEVQTPDPAPVAATYTIVSGDTVGSIAERFGIPVQSLLDANGLDWSSVIFSGHTLVIPAGGSATPSSAPAASAGDGLNDDTRANAAVIIRVGRELGVSDYGIVIALATAMQESSMRNLDWGDLDSVGLFQQRPSAGWGSVEQLTDPEHAARLFYGGPSNPNRGWTRGLLDISGWDSMPLTEAAQSVQISAYPDAYAKWEFAARSWLAELG